MIITNITNIGDPQIILYEGVYYCYATSFINGIYVWQSEDLENWSTPTVCFDAGEDHWADRDFWAPEVVEHNGKFIMHYTARERGTTTLRLAAAVADSPLGPFRMVSQDPLLSVDYANIDGSVLITDEGNYLYYSRDCTQNYVDGMKTSQVYCVMLDDTLTKAVGEPRLMTTPTEEWEMKSLNIQILWNEGPCVIRYGDRYIMNYSTNYYASNDYAICIATAKDPFGPWEKQAAANPVLSCREGLFGAGHNAFFTAKDGRLMTSFHIQTNPEKPSGDRRICIGEVRFTEKDGVLYQEII